MMQQILSHRRRTIKDIVMMHRQCVLNKTITFLLKSLYIGTKKKKGVFPVSTQYLRVGPLPGLSGALRLIEAP